MGLKYNCPVGMALDAGDSFVLRAALLGRQLSSPVCRQEGLQSGQCRETGLLHAPSVTPEDLVPTQGFLRMLI